MEKHLAQGAEMVLCVTVNNLFPPKKYGENFKCPRSVPRKPNTTWPVSTAVSVGKTKKAGPAFSKTLPSAGGGGEVIREALLQLSREPFLLSGPRVPRRSLLPRREAPQAPGVTAHLSCPLQSLAGSMHVAEEGRRGGRLSNMQPEYLTA